MGPLTVEGVVENGRIRLRGDVTLPERATVYVIVPGVAAAPAHVVTPRLARPERAVDFAKQVIEVPGDAG